MERGPNYLAVLDRLLPSGLADPEALEALAALEHPPADPRAAADLVGSCLWDLFSDNNEVIDHGGAVVDLGSFRGSGDTIATWAGAHAQAQGLDWRWGYLDFYLGTRFLPREGTGRDGAALVYRILFRRLASCGMDWRYTHPRLYLVDVGSAEGEGADRWTDPTAAVARDLEQAQRDAEVAELRRVLEEDYREAVRLARAGPPPDTVAAYREAYGRFPVGWPPPLDGE
jgi:hypothetical protein